MARRTKTRRWLKRLFIGLPLAFTLLTLAQVLVLRWLDPPATSFMAGRQLSVLLGDDERSLRLDYRWRNLERISPQLPLAVVAAEDQRFPAHHGFDLEAMKKAYHGNQRGRKIRGGSTISQQLAKNLFLWSGRSYLRKGLEAWYTFWIELLWPKRRILEVYVNVVEFGDGVYGVEAAAQRYFGKPAARLSRSEAARLAAVLPSPRKYSARKPGPYVQRRARAIERQMRGLGGTSYLSGCCRE